MALGWFDAFRERGAPTWYGDNRTPVVVDPPTLAVCAVFGIFLAALLPAVPALRRRKLDSMLSVTLVTCVGAAILVPLLHPNWHVSETDIVAPYRAFAPVKLHAKLGVRIGLSNVNITLTTRGNASAAGLDYNERFSLNHVRSMQRELADALHSGMPYPMLTAIEYLSVDRAGFAWGRHYRAAGYYTGALLSHCLGLWALAVLCLCMCAEYFSRISMCLGASLMVSVSVYAYSVPWRHPLVIRFPPIDPADGAPLLQFRFGWCFWLVLAAGVLCFLYGIALRHCERNADYRHTTCLEPGFDRGHRVSKLRPESATVARSVSQQGLASHRIRPLSPLHIDALSPAICGASVASGARHKVVERRKSLKCPDATNLGTHPTALVHWRLGDACAVSPKHAPPYGDDPPPTVDCALSGVQVFDSDLHEADLSSAHYSGTVAAAAAAATDHQPATKKFTTSTCVTTIAVGSPPPSRRSPPHEMMRAAAAGCASGGSSRDSHGSSWQLGAGSSGLGTFDDANSGSRPQHGAQRF